MQCAARVIAILFLSTAAADAGVTRIEIGRREPFAAGQPFASAGAYERIVGRFYGELDPAHDLNAGIVDLDKAPRNARGKVAYSSDFEILKPVDLGKGNGALLYDVNNRGNKRALIQFNNAPATNDPTTPDHAGNGFLMRHGYTVVWSGWIPGLPAANNALRIEVPTAAPAGGRIEQVVWDEFLFNVDGSTQARLTFPATSTDTSRATLLVRARNADEPTLVAPDQWEFAGRQSIRLKPAAPFRIGAIYQLIYRAADPPVAGIGFAASRDLVSFLRYAVADEAGTPNPLAADGRPAVDRALAHGTSQSGRYLRDFVYRGFNEDESNRIVFDGINPHVATARLFLNHRFAQPNRITHTAHGFMFFPDVSFPFAYETQADPFTGVSDGILARCASRGNCPKVIHTQTATEYWQSGQSLITTDALGRRDGTAPDLVRIYHFAGTQHIEIQIMPKGVCATPYNTVDYRPLLRGALAALDRWVKDGAAPPPSRHPRLADETLVPMTAPDVPIPGFPLPQGPNPRPRFDYGPDFAKGIISQTLPVTLGDHYKVLVPKVDVDGNETTGVRLPDIAVPTATNTGWAVRSGEAGAAGELCYLDGSRLPFARSKAEREAQGDPRPSLEERYRGPADYAAKVQSAVSTLTKEGFLLPEDAQRITERAASTAW